jgi:nitrogen fixation/metabolism regulation signal transduction histidine kinase
LILAFLPTASLILLSYYLATEGSRLLAARGISETLATADSLAMWIIAGEQQDLAHELDKALELDSISGAISQADLLWIRSEIDTTAYSQLPQSMINRLAADFSEADSGRSVIDSRLVVWACRASGDTTVCAARFLPDRYFELATRVVEGKTRFHSLSRTLLPIGQDLLLKGAIALMIVSLLLSLLAAQMLSYGTSAPLEKLVEATRRVSRGDLKYRIPAASRDEIGVLISNFNRMTSKLETATTELLKAEREMTWRETARTIAHEIKNLLTPVNIALFKIKQHLGSAAAPEAELMQSVDALALEVDAIADLARQFSLFAHPPKLAQERLDLHEVVQESIAIHADLADRHELSIRIADDASEVKADHDLLRRALSNLIKNSLEATPYGGRVEVSSNREGDDLVLEIADDGPGADQAIDLTLPYITTKKSGTGLGLAIVKKVCEAHGWVLSYGNAEPGFRVTIRIPIEND